MLFAPLNDALLRHMPARRNLAALLTLLVIMTMVIIPAFLLAAFLLQEVTSVYALLQSALFIAIWEMFSPSAGPAAARARA